MDELLLTLTAAATTGFLGSLHCIGMCGPVVMAVCADKEGPLRRGAGYLTARLVG